MPAPAVERRDAVADQTGADAVEAPELGVPGEDAADDLGLVRFYFPLGGGRVVRIAVATPAERLGHAAGPRPLDLAPGGPLDDLLALDLGGEGPQAHDQLPERRILHLLGDALQRYPGLFGLVEQDRELRLVPREPIDGVGEQHVDCALAEESTHAFHAGPVEGVAAGRVTDRLDDAPA